MIELQMLLELLKTVHRHVIQHYQHLRSVILQKQTKVSVQGTKIRKEVKKMTAKIRI